MSSNMNEKPTVTDKLQAAFSSKTAEEIHQEKLAKREDNNMDSGNNFRGQPTTNTAHGVAHPASTHTTSTGTTTGTTVPGTQSHQNAYDETGKPTMTDHVKGAFSYKTAQQIHDENVAKDQSKNAGNYGTAGSSSYGMSGPTIHSDTAGSSTTYGSTAGNQNYGSTAGTTTYGSTAGSHQATTHLQGGQMSSGQTTRTEMNVKSVAADAMRQIDAQAQDAMMKAEALRKQDEARLTQSSTGAFTQLDSQAEQLKAKIDAEKLAAQEEINRQQLGKLDRTRERSEMEKRAIHEAAMRRKAELEAKSNKLQHEIEELTRIKTQEMMQEKPGDLQVTHVSEDTGVVAKLTGAVAHKLGIQKDTHVTQSITEGHVQHQPVQVQKQYATGAADAHTHTQNLGTTHESYTLPTKSATSGTVNTAAGTRSAELADSKRNI